MTDQQGFDVLDWGIVLNPSDPDVVVSLKRQYVDGDLSLLEFESRLDSMIGGKND